MLLARVIGNVVATQKNQRYEGTRAMLCRQITPEGKDMDYTCIALDSVNAGEGDIVIIAQEGWSASTASTGKAGADPLSSKWCRVGRTATSFGWVA